MSNLMAHLRAGGFNNDSIAVCLCILAAAMLQAYVIWRGARAFRAASYRIMATVMPSIVLQTAPQRKQPHLRTERLTALEFVLTIAHSLYDRNGCE